MDDASGLSEQPASLDGMIRATDRHRIGKARLLRRDGKTYDEIRAIIGPVSNDELRAWLRGIPRPAGTRRSRSLPEVARECRRLRALGLTHGEIVEQTGASVGSVSLWLRDVKVPASVEQRRQAHLQHVRGRGSQVLHDAAIQRQRERVDAAFVSIANLTPRDLFMVGVALYWAEGTKDKPWRRSGRVTFTNSDPTVVQVFSAWLDLLDVAADQRRYRLSIHESADVAIHEQWWRTVLGSDDLEFLRATLKRHNPKPSRHNRNEAYHGCLVITVARSVALYDAIDGWWRAIAARSKAVV